MKYTYQNAMSAKHYIKCRGYCPEWINQDRPDIHRMDGTRAIEITFPQYEAVIYPDNDKEYKTLKQWLLLNGMNKNKIY